MQFAEKIIEAFIQLLETQLSLFSAQDLTELDKLIPTLPADPEPLSQAIIAWCENRDKERDKENPTHILAALRQVRQTLSRGESNTEKSPKGSIPRSDLKNYKYKEKLNAIRQSFPPSPPPPSGSDK